MICLVLVFLVLRDSSPQIFDRLLASIGQDTLDTLYWLAAESNLGKSRRNMFKIFIYFFIAVVYVCILTQNPFPSC